MNTLQTCMIVWKNNFFFKIHHSLNLGRHVCVCVIAFACVFWVVCVCLVALLSCCLCLFVFICLSLSVCLCLFVFICLSLSVCLYLFVFVCLCLSVCLYLFVFVCLSLSVCLCLFVFVCLPLSVCLGLLIFYVYVCVCLCLYICAISVNVSGSLVVCVSVERWFICISSWGREIEHQKYTTFLTFLFWICLIFAFSCLFVCQSEEQLQHIDYFCLVEKCQILLGELWEAVAQEMCLLFVISPCEPLLLLVVWDELLLVFPQKW